MLSWSKLQPKYEKIAYRIVQNHIGKMIKKIPIDTMTLSNYELMVRLNIFKEDIFDMYVEIYKTIGYDYADRLGKDLDEMETKATSLFNQKLLKEIIVYLQTNGGVKITSVSDTIANDIIKSIKAGLGENATVIELQNAIYSIVNNTQKFYKYQALRIARTETTASSGFAAMSRARESRLVLIKEWISVQDNRTRVTPFDHLDMNGQLQELEKPFYVGGEDIMYAGDVNASAGNVINCRCTIAFRGKKDAEGNLIFKS